MNSLSVDRNTSSDDNTYIDSTLSIETLYTLSNPPNLSHEATESHRISSQDGLIDPIFSNEPPSTINKSLVISERVQSIKVQSIPSATAYASRLEYEETPENEVRRSLEDICTSHEIIEDLIDITPDRSKYIYYCINCYECFIDLSGNLYPAVSK